MKRESIGLYHITALSLIVAKVHSQSGEVSEMNKCYFLVVELAEGYSGISLSELHRLE